MITYNEQKRSLYDLEWQILRVNLDFTTLDNTQNSIERCTLYLKQQAYSAQALYKVVNLYAATVMGFNGQRSRLVGYVAEGAPGAREEFLDIGVRIDVVTEARKVVSKMYADAKTFGVKFEVDQEKRLADIKAAKTIDLMDVYKNLRKRWRGARKRNYSVQRDELYEYLTMLTDEFDARHVIYLELK